MGLDVPPEDVADADVDQVVTLAQQLRLGALAAALHSHDHVLAHEPPCHAGGRRRVTISAHGRGRDRRRGRAGRSGGRARADQPRASGSRCSTRRTQPTSAARRTGRSAGCSSSTARSSAGCGVHGLGRAGLERLAGQRAVRPPGRRGRVGGPVGPGRTWSSPPGRSAPGWPGSGSRSCRPSAGPSAATCARTGTATRCPASTSPGAPAPAWSSRSSPRPCRRPRPGLLTFHHRHRVDELLVERGRGHRRPRHGAGRRTTRRAASPSNRTRSGEFALTAPVVIVTTGGIGAQPRPRPAVLARAARHAPDVDGHRCAGVRGRADARHRRRGRRPAGQPGPDVALHRGRAELEPDLARARHPDPARPVVDVVRRARAGGCPRRACPATTRSARCGTCARRRTWPATTTPGSS